MVYHFEILRYFFIIIVMCIHGIPGYVLEMMGMNCCATGCTNQYQKGSGSYKFLSIIVRFRIQRGKHTC